MLTKHIDMSAWTYFCAILYTTQTIVPVCVRSIFVFVCMTHLFELAIGVTLTKHIDISMWTYLCAILYTTQSSVPFCVRSILVFVCMTHLFELVIGVMLTKHIDISMWTYLFAILYTTQTSVSVCGRSILIFVSMAHLFELVIGVIDRAPDGVEFAKCEDRNLLIVLSSEKLAHYNSWCCQEVRWSIYFLYLPVLDIK